MTIPISACIMCKNEEAKIARALDSLAWAAEILLVDSGSTDQTLQIAANHPTKPRILHHPWLGYRAQRQFMVSQCKHPWVLMLDADEEVNALLARTLAGLKESDLVSLGILAMPRRNYLARRYVRCWSPDYQKRLIHKDRVSWDTSSQFDTWSVSPGFSIRRLPKSAGAIEHNRLSPFDEKDFTDAGLIAERAALMATYLYNNGKRASFLNILTRPPITFLKFYILRAGFLDGRFGLTIAWKTTMGVIAKYSVLYGQEMIDRQQRDLGPKGER